MSHIDDGIIGQINGQIRIFHALVVRILCGDIGGLITSEDCLGAGHQFLGIKRFFHIIIRTQLQSQYFVEDFTFCGKHDDGNGVLCTDLSAHLITVNAGKHQIQQNQIRSKGLHSRHHGFPVIDDHGIKAFLRQIEGDQFRNIIIIIYDENFLFTYHVV